MTRIILVISVDVFIIFILIYLIKRGAFLPILLNITFAAHDVPRCIFPRGIQTLSFTPCVHVALTQDDQSPSLLAISAALDHLYMRSYCLYPMHITALQSSPSHFRSRTNEKRWAMPTRQPVDSPAEHSPIPAPATTTAAHPELLLAAQGIPRVVIKLPRKYMDVVDRRFGPDGGYDKQRQRRRRLVARMT